MDHGNDLDSFLREFYLKTSSKVFRRGCRQRLSSGGVEILISVVLNANGSVLSSG